MFQIPVRMGTLVPCMFLSVRFLMMAILVMSVYDDILKIEPSEFKKLCMASQRQFEFLLGHAFPYLLVQREIPYPFFTLVKVRRHFAKRVSLVYEMWLGRMGVAIFQQLGLKLNQRVTGLDFHQ